MKFPNYSSDAQGDLLIAGALAADELRPYAEVQHFDQTVQKKGMHLYVESEKAEDEDIEVTPAFGGVIRLVGHEPGLNSRGYSTFKANGKSKYEPTTDLYAKGGQTAPFTTWSTFWRNGLSGPAAKWAQFARGAAKAYAAFNERERTTWSTDPDIGDAVVLLPSTQDPKIPVVFCIRGVGPVEYIEVRVVPVGQFSASKVPKEIVRLFGGIPIPPLASDWVARGKELLTYDDVRIACDAAVDSTVWGSHQDSAFGCYAVSPKGDRVDTVRMYRDGFSGLTKNTHIKLTFTVSPSHALSADIEKVSAGYIQSFGATSRGVDLPMPSNFVAPGPGYIEGGEATAPWLVTYVAGKLTTFSWTINRVEYGGLLMGYDPPMRESFYEIAIKVRGGVSKDYGISKTFKRIDDSFKSNSTRQVHTVVGAIPWWTETFFREEVVNERIRTEPQPAPARSHALHFCGVEGCWVSTSAVGTTPSVNPARTAKGTLTHSHVLTYYNENVQVVNPADTFSSTVFAKPFFGPLHDPVSPESEFWTGSIVVEDPVGTPQGPMVAGPVEIFARGKTFTDDLIRLYSDAGEDPFSWATGGLTYLPRSASDPLREVFVDIAASDLGGEQIVVRFANMQDTNRAYAGLTHGSLVTSSEDAQFPHTHRVFFVGELQK